MYKIDKQILNRLQLSDFVFKYPFNDGTIKNIFNPNIDKDFEKLMIINKENGKIRLNKETIFTHENPETILDKTETSLLDGTWWVLPKVVNNTIFYY